MIPDYKINSLTRLFFIRAVMPFHSWKPTISIYAPDEESFNPLERN